MGLSHQDLGWEDLSTFFPLLVRAKLVVMFQSSVLTQVSELMIESYVILTTLANGEVWFQLCF